MNRNDTRTGSLAHVLIPLLLFGSMGPYVWRSLRLEHFLIYPVTLFVVTRHISNGGFRLTFESIGFTVLMVCGLLWGMASQLLNGGFETTSLAALENYLQPVALATIGLLSPAVIDISRQEFRIKQFCRVVLFLNALNSVVALANLFGYFTDLDEFYGVGVTSTGFSVRANSIQMGRFIGLFGQPVEAGVSYSIALACFGYLVSRYGFSVLDLAAFSLVFVGGCISISKAFLGVGFPVFLFIVLSSGGGRQLKGILYVVAALATVLLSWSFFKVDWSGQDFFGRYFESDTYSRGSWIQVLSANRVGGSESGASYGVSAALESSPLAGFGFTEVEFALDSAFTEVIWRGGLIGLMIYIFQLLFVLACGIRSWGVNRFESVLLVGVGLITVFTGLGGPTFTMNRVSVSLILLIASLIRACSFNDPRSARFLLPNRFSMPNANQR